MHEGRLDPRMSPVQVALTDEVGGRTPSRVGSLEGVEAMEVTRRFGTKVVLSDVSLSVARGQIQALLGPNGAGKTTLLRILTGLLEPSEGSVRVLGVDTVGSPRGLRQLIGLVPSGDRSFYLRITGLENLVFFARLHGMRRREAVARAGTVLEEVGLASAARTRVGHYSHGMQKRLSVARALLTEPPILLVDEATHDLDPDGALRVRDLVGAAAARGAAVVWATQRLDEIRGLAHGVTLLSEGKVRFSGSVAELMEHAEPRRYLVRLRNGRPADYLLESAGRTALGGLGSIRAAGDGFGEHYLLSLADGTVLGDALAALTEADISVLACREERSEIEEAFLSLTGSTP
jgi:ABC-type multidrug transport system ATPase subunit